MFFCGSRNAKIDRGANFCQVDKIRHEVHEIEAITEGYQKWQGALPSFNRAAIIRTEDVMVGTGKLGTQRAILDINNMAEPIAWVK